MLHEQMVLSALDKAIGMKPLSFVSRHKEHLVRQVSYHMKVAGYRGGGLCYMIIL